MASKQNRIIFIFLGILFFLAIIITWQLYKISEEVKQEPAQLMLDEYMKLDSTYLKAIDDLEEISTNPYDNIGILKSNLVGIRKEITDNISQLEKIRQTGIAKITYDSATIQNYHDRLEMSKAVAKSLMDERLLEIEARNEAIEEMKQAEMQKSYNKETKLARLKSFYEVQKAKNENLFATIHFIKEKVKYLRKEGNVTPDEIDELDKKVDEYNRELDFSKKQIESHNQQINQYLAPLKLINMNVYFLLNEGVEDAEGVVFLTSNGVSRQFLNYFVKNKPAIHFKFDVSDKIIASGATQLELIVYNSEDEEMYSTSTEVKNSGTLHIRLEGGFFNPGRYKVKLKNSDKDMLIGEEYIFRI